MSAMDVDGDISTILASMRSANEASSDIVQALYQFEDFYERKLWHQLTIALEEFFFLTPEATPQLKRQIYDQFVSQFASKLNPIKVTDFALDAYGDDPEAAIEKLEQLRTSVEREIRANNYRPTTGNAVDDERNQRELAAIVDAADAVNFVDLQLARFWLHTGDVARAEAVLDRLAAKFDAVGTVSGSAAADANQKVAAAYFHTKYQLYKSQHNYNDTYRNGLLYLSSVDPSTVSAAARLELCYDLSMAALLGDKIYNFGELVLHDILGEIKDNQYAWLYQLIHTLNAGDKPQFLKHLETGASQSPQLAAAHGFLVEKITIMSLLELISRHSAKVLTFKEIGEFTGTEPDQVELLIIKCLSLDLIKGSINQIDGILHVTWLQPRILNLDQVKGLYNHLIAWDQSVEKLATEVHQHGGAIWAEN
ncbi:26S proteasome regulatory subunit Rpn9p [Diutina catenulata]